MAARHTLPVRLFERLVLRHPVLVLLAIAAAALILRSQISAFRLDASAHTLVMEDDKDLQLARLLEQRYGSGDMLVIAFTPKQDLFSAETLDVLHKFRDDLSLLQNVESVTTILDVPLLESPPVGLKGLGSKARTLRSPGTDMELAKRELATSPLYSRLLVSPDLRTTSILLHFPDDKVYLDLLRTQGQLKAKKRQGQLTGQEQQQMRQIAARLLSHHDRARRTRHNDIVAIRAVMDKYRDWGQLYLGGVSMIADDMISFIKKDLQIFGASVFLLMVLVLALIFRRPIWVLLACLVCAVSVLFIVGLLGYLRWEVTVISSNFISLQLIITLAMAIHVIVRYRELAAQDLEADQYSLLTQTIATILRPCVYSGLTTVGGFASLVFSDIRPVVSFGRIMVLGVLISMAIPLLLVPSVLMLVPRERTGQVEGKSAPITMYLARLTAARGRMILLVGGAVLAFNIAGMSRLEVENCFINYFKGHTEIHQGLRLIDQKLGGTTPLDVVIDFPQPSPMPAQEEDDLLAEFQQPDPEIYWFTPEKISIITAAHDYLASLPETGKVLSLATLVKMIERQNDGRPLDALELALLFKQVPSSIRQLLVRPYVSVEHSQARISVRVLDSQPTLRRKQLIDRINRELGSRVGLSQDRFHLGGLLVLYNNMLQSLYRSQVLTLGLAMLMLLGTFTVLFRSIPQAMIAIVPNAFAISCVLGLMGWMGIPLDMMTITIAAIGVGLADDDTIHYMHRFRHELAQGHGYLQAMYRAHASTGRAIYYTTIALVIGFSVLVLSDFVPSTYFGLLTGLAIFMALVGSLTILPQLILVIRPFGRQVPSGGGGAGPS